jgi:cell division protein FtsZ
MKELLQPRPEILITVVGIGGCGCNTINMLRENGLADSVNLLAVNTDLAVLNHIEIESKILIGENLTNGYGAGADPAVGLKAAQESEALLTNALKDSDIVIITAGFGGGTGTGASPLVAKLARELGISCLAIVTLPFESEGKMRMDYALQGIAEIKEPIQAYITLSNDLLLKGLGESVGLFSAFNQSNEVLKNLLSALVQMLTQTGYINVDKNDFARILSFEGESVLGVGKAESEESSLDALDQALNNPLVSLANIGSAKGIIIQICCREEIKLATYEGIIKQVRSKLTDDSALIVVGVTLDPNLLSEVEILLIASGIDEQVNNSVKIEAQKQAYLDDGLSFISSDKDPNIEQTPPSALSDEDYTDIPAIIRKLRENQKLKDVVPDNELP